MQDEPINPPSRLEYFWPALVVEGGLRGSRVDAFLSPTCAKSTIQSRQINMSNLAESWHYIFCFEELGEPCSAVRMRTSRQPSFRIVVWRRYMRRIKSDSSLSENTQGWHYMPKSAIHAT
jgi:hypothetical protein